MATVSTVHVFVNLLPREPGRLLIVVFAIRRHTKKEKLYADHKAENFFVANLVKQSGEMLNFQWKNTLIGKTAIVHTEVSLDVTPKKFVNVAVPRIFGF